MHLFFIPAHYASCMFILLHLTFCSLIDIVVMQFVDDEYRDNWRTSVNLMFNCLTWILADKVYRIFEEVHRL